MTNYTKTGLSLILLVYCHYSNAQARIDPRNISALCMGLGQAAASVAMGREQGIPDDENEGVQVLERISRHSGNDFVAEIGQFLKQSAAIPPLWRGMLYTHACWHSYLDNNAQVSLMVSLLPYRCDLNQPAMDCIDKTFHTLPNEATII